MNSGSSRTLTRPSTTRTCKTFFNHPSSSGSSSSVTRETRTTNREQRPVDTRQELPPLLEDNERQLEENRNTFTDQMNELSLDSWIIRHSKQYSHTLACHSSSLINANQKISKLKDALSDNTKMPLDILQKSSRLHPDNDEIALKQSELFIQAQIDKLVSKTEEMELQITNHKNIFREEISHIATLSNIEMNTTILDKASRDCEKRQKNTIAHMQLKQLNDHKKKEAKRLRAEENRLKNQQIVELKTHQLNSLLKRLNTLEKQLRSIQQLKKKNSKNSHGTVEVAKIPQPLLPRKKRNPKTKLKGNGEY